MKSICIFLALTAVIMFSSCEKDYSCMCTTKITPPNSLSYQTGTKEDIKHKVSKKKAKKICDNTALQIEANTKLLFTGSNYKISTGCTVQEK